MIDPRGQPKFQKFYNGLRKRQTLGRGLSSAQGCLSNVGRVLVAADSELRSHHFMDAQEVIAVADRVDFLAVPAQDRGRRVVEAPSRLAVELLKAGLAELVPDGDDSRGRDQALLGHVQDDPARSLVRNLDGLPLGELRVLIREAGIELVERGRNQRREVAFDIGRVLAAEHDERREGEIVAHKDTRAGAQASRKRLIDGIAKAEREGEILVRLGAQGEGGKHLLATLADHGVILLFDFPLASIQLLTNEVEHPAVGDWVPRRGRGRRGDRSNAILRAMVPASVGGKGSGSGFSLSHGGVPCRG
jgi:hypothetical protein